MKSKVGALVGTAVCVSGFLGCGGGPPKGPAAERGSAVLLTRLGDPDAKVREETAAAMERDAYLFEEEAQALGRALQDENPRVRQRAVVVFANVTVQMQMAMYAMPKARQQELGLLMMEAASQAVLRLKASGKDVSKAPGGMASNETAAIAACKTLAEAEEIYRRMDWDGDGVLEYAQSIRGRHSLYEPSEGKADLHLVEAAFAQAEGSVGSARPKAGYVFKILKGQGPAAPGGRKSYLVNGNMTQGYALVASPSVWDETGRNTFLMGQAGTVYQKDLGPSTAKSDNGLGEYDPDPTWVVSE